MVYEDNGLSSGADLCRAKEWSGSQETGLKGFGRDVCGVCVRP